MNKWFFFPYSFRYYWLLRFPPAQCNVVAYIIYYFTKIVVVVVVVVFPISSIFSTLVIAVAAKLSIPIFNEWNFFQRLLSHIVCYFAKHIYLQAHTHTDFPSKNILQNCMCNWFPAVLHPPLSPLFIVIVSFVALSFIDMKIIIKMILILKFISEIHAMLSAFYSFAGVEKRQKIHLFRTYFQFAGMII